MVQASKLRGMRLSISSGKDLALRRDGAMQQMSPTGERLLASLAAESARGDRTAFGRIYEVLADDIFAFVSYRTGGEAGLAEAEDIVAEVFL